MCYAQEGYVQSSNGGTLGLEQFKTILYSVFAIGLIGLAVGIGENVAKRVLKKRIPKTLENSCPSLELRNFETLGNPSHSLEGKNPILCQKCSSNFMLVLIQLTSESGGILELKKLIFSENGGIMEEMR